MSVDSIITILICAGAAVYVGRSMRSSAKKLLAPRPSGTCGGCTGCAASVGQSEDSDDARVPGGKDCTRVHLPVLGD